MTPETPKEESRLVTLYRLRADQAEYNAETWCKVVHLLMQQNQENASGIDQIRHQFRFNGRELECELSNMQEFILKVEGVLRRALAIIDGTSTEEKTEVREAIARLLT